MSDITSRLQAAISDDGSATVNEPEETETPEAEAAEESEEQDQGTRSEGAKATGKQTVPYTRFKEKVDQADDLASRLEEANVRLSTAMEREENLRGELENLSSEAEVLERVRDLADDERYKDHVMAIDRALKGIEDDVESGEITEKEGQDLSKEVIQELKEELKEEADNNMVNLLFQQCSNTIDGYLSALDEAGFDEDATQLIKELAVPRIDWDAIEVDPSDMNEQIAKGLTEALETVERIRTDGTDEETESDYEPQESPAELLQKVIDVDWSKTDDKGNSVHSDATFADALAHAMRTTRE
jgi:polyhydroxyalkanoate synthesis regulator phasin